MVVFIQKIVHDPQRSQQMVVVPQGKTVCLLNIQEDNKCWFSPRKQFVRLQTKSLAPQKSACPHDKSFKDAKSKGKMVKFLYLPSNGILPPSAGKKFEEETN